MKKTFIATILATAFLHLFFAGLSDSALAGEEKTLAVVGGEKIDERYLEQKIQTLPRIVQSRYDKTALGPKVLEDIVDSKVFAHAARELKLDERPLVQFKIKDAIDGILAVEYQTYLLEKAFPTEAEVKKYYDDNKDRFKIPEAVKVRHIALKSEKEAKEVLAWALNRLSAEDRMVVEMVYLEGMTGREAAELLGWSVTNVKVRSFRSRIRLRKLLSGLLEREEAK